MKRKGDVVAHCIYTKNFFLYNKKNILNALLTRRNGNYYARVYVIVHNAN